MTDSGPPLVGRQGALQVIAKALSDLSKGRGTLIDVVGEPGMGKTRLIDAFLAASDGCDHRRGAADPRDTDRVFSALPPDLSAIARAAHPRHGPVLDLTGMITGPRTARGYVALDAVLEEVQKRAADRPQVIGVDDAQWADLASCLALRSLANVLSSEPIILVVARRPGVCEWSRLVEDLNATPVVLRPLSHDNVLEVATALLSARPGPRLGAELDGLGGNPFAVLEALADVRTAGKAVEVNGEVELAPGSELTKVVIGRLQSLPPNVVDLLRVAAVLGPTFGAGDLAALSDRSAAQLVVALRSAVESGVLSDEVDLRFTHELIREELLGELPDSLRRALHTDAATHLAAVSAEPSVVAHHILAGDGRLPLGSAQLLRRVAAELSVHDPNRAAALMRRAVDGLPRDSGEWVDANCDLAQSLMLAGRLDAAEEVALQALSSPDRVDQERQLRQILGEIRFAEGDLAEALRELERIDVLDGGRDRQAKAETAILRLLSFDLEGARREALAVLDRSSGAEPGPRSVANMAMSSIETAEGRTAMSVKHAREAVRDADESPFGQVHLLQPHLFLGIALSADDQDEGARSALRASFEIGRQRGSGWEVPLWHGAVAAEHYRCGQLDDCAAECETGLSLSREHGLHLADVLLASHAALVALHRGDLDEVDRALTVAEVALGKLGPRIGSVHFAWAKALQLEVSGDASQARAILQMAVDFAVATGLVGRLSIIGPDLARMSVAQRDGDAARALVGHLDEVAQRSAAPSVRAAALRSRAWAFEDPDAALAAVACFEQCHRPLEEARTREDAGRVLSLTGSRPVAAALINQARDFFEGVGAVADLSRIELFDASTRSRSANRPVTGWDSLTTSEQKVSLLVAEGLSNPEVGERLFISRRTVETHLYRTYAKLHVSSRVELTLLVEREVRSKL